MDIEVVPTSWPVWIVLWELGPQVQVQWMMKIPFERPSLIPFCLGSGSGSTQRWQEVLPMIPSTQPLLPLTASDVVERHGWEDDWQCAPVSVSESHQRPTWNRVDFTPAKWVNVLGETFNPVVLRFCMPLYNLSLSQGRDLTISRVKKWRKCLFTYLTA